MRRAPGVQIGANAKAFGEVPAGDMVILAVPYSAVLDLVKKYDKKLVGKILIDITNPVASDRVSLVTPAESSGAQEIAKLAPADAKVFKAFNTLFSHTLTAGTVDGKPVDVFVAGDETEAKARVSDFIESLGLRAMDTGKLAMARTLEYICLLSLGVMANSLKHTHFAIGISLVRQEN